jgi:hypothetical protein
MKAVGRRRNVNIFRPIAPGYAVHSAPVDVAAANCRYCAGQRTAKRPPRERTTMLMSRDRILTTHVGSLPRNEKLSDLLMAQEEGKAYDPKVLA